VETLHRAEVSTLREAHEVKKMTNNKPVKQFGKGAVKASLFEREQEGPKGAFVSQSVNLQIGYTDGLTKEGKPNWINHNLTIVSNNIEATIKVLQEAQTEMTERRRMRTSSLSSQSGGSLK